MSARKAIETADPEDEVVDDVELTRQWEAFYASVAPSPADVRRADAIFDALTKAPRRKRGA